MKFDFSSIYLFVNDGFLIADFYRRNAGKNREDARRTDESSTEISKRARKTRTRQQRVTQTAPP